MEIAPGLHRIGDDVIAAYLLVDERGITVVDAGLPGHIRALRAELRALGRSESDIRGVVLTHAHSDHTGFAERLRAEHGVPVFTSEREAVRARGEENPGKQENPKVRIGGALRFVWVGLRHLGRTRPVGEVTTFRDGEVLPLPGDPRVVALAGHTPGHVALHSAAVGALFVGDALTTRHVLTGAVGPQDAPFSEDPAAAKAVLERLRGESAQYVLPGHGVIWRDGVPALLDAIAASRA